MPSFQIKDLRSFLQEVRELGPAFYVEVKRPLKPKLELWVLQEKLAREQGRFPVIYCPKIEGSDFPLVSNLWGSWELFGLALGMNPRKVGKADVLHEYKKRRDNPKPFKTIASSKAPIKEVIQKGQDVDLTAFPIIHHAPMDSGRYITCGQLVCKDPDTGIPNVGMYRMELKGKNKLGILIAPAQHANYIARRNADLGRIMEVVIYVGHHPVLGAGAVFTGPLDLCEFDVVGGFLERPLETVKAETSDLPVPAEAELAIEGTIDPRNMETDGPFAEFTGYYGEVAKCYIINVNAVTRRKDMIYNDLSVGCWEHSQLNTLGATAAVHDAVARVVPSVKHVYLPPSGKGVLTAYISIPKRIEGEAKRAGMAAINSIPPVRFAVVVDEDINVYNEQEVMWAVATRATPDQDIDIITRVPGSILDPTSYNELRLERGSMTSKMIIDATRPLGLPFPHKIEPPEDLWRTMKLEDYLE